MDSSERWDGLLATIQGVKVISFIGYFFKGLSLLINLSNINGALILNEYDLKRRSLHPTTEKGPSYACEFVPNRYWLVGGRLQIRRKP